MDKLPLEIIIFNDTGPQKEQTLLAALLIRAVRDLLDINILIRVDSYNWFHEIYYERGNPRFTFPEVCDALELDKTTLLKRLGDLGCFRRVPSRRILELMPSYGWHGLKGPQIDHEKHNPHGEPHDS